MLLLRAFIAGFLSTLIFHQGLLGLLHAGGFSPRTPYSFAPAGPLHIPSVLSLAFWGGIWAIGLGFVLRDLNGANYWLSWTIAGAVGPSVVALFVVFPLKGMPIAGGWDPKIIIGALLLNAAWGIGVALLLRYLPQFR
jgi:hypothetical protein